METLIDNDPEGNGVQIELTGSWENKGRIITAAALTGLAEAGYSFMLSLFYPSCSYLYSEIPVM